MDGAVPADGDRRLAHLARALPPQTPRRAHGLRDPAAAQRALAGAAFRRKKYRRRPIHHRRSMADDCLDHSRILARVHTRRMVVGAVPRLGEFRNGAQSRHLASQSVNIDPIPRTHLLANGDYSVMITAAGSGYSRWRDLAVTRWREDPTCDPWGFFIFLHDVADGRVWSAGYQPAGREPDSYDVAFFEDRAEIVRKDGPILTATEILVSPQDDAEVRRVSITNTGRGTREIELTTYAEVVLAPPAADSAHPAFSKMFVQTEFVGGTGTLLATRRKREPS